MTSDLNKLGGNVEVALESISVPSYVVDPTGIIRWLNPAARRLVGDVRGRQFTSVIAPEETRRSRETFARHIAGPPKPHDTQVVVIGANGERIGVELSSVPLIEGDHVVGVFGQVADIDEIPPRPAHPHLTPRQAEVLRLLEHGRRTHDIAHELNLSVETVRNHIRHILRALGVHSRLEAVALAHREHLLSS